MESDGDRPRWQSELLHERQIDSVVVRRSERLLRRPVRRLHGLLEIGPQALLLLHPTLCFPGILGIRHDRVIRYQPT